MKLSRGNSSGLTVQGNSSRKEEKKTVHLYNSLEFYSRKEQRSRGVSGDILRARTGFMMYCSLCGIGSCFSMFV